MDEAAVKAQVLKFIRQAGGSRAAIVTAEFSLGRSGVRADLALLADDELIGIEIKTERDTLRRLPAQMDGYAKYFDHVVLAIAPCHLDGLAPINLRGASVWIVTDEGVRVQKIGEPNAISATAQIELLTADEKRKLVTNRQPIRDQVCKTFAKRYSETSNNFWKLVKGRAIRPQDVQFLSRFREHREAVKIIALEKESRWLRWRNSYSSTSIDCVA
jgi:hypothetical protein